ncbi:MAG: carboxypeptidase-like regulatory domain-containing protein [Ferruginibacter sp.]
MLSTPTKKTIYSNLLVVFISLLFFSCQKELTFDNGFGNQPPDLSTKINSSVSGFVTDENDAPVLGATVQFGTSTITTDKYGYFQAKDVQVVKNAAFVTVNKTGYFKGIKTYIAKEGKAAFFRIKLIPKIIAGTVNSTAGGTVTLVNGLSIKLNAGTIVNAATNAQYSGSVNVASFWINPEAADLNQIMPGDLRGIDKDGYLKLLQTFGMAAVELTGSSGELLQIVNGQTATLTMPIPSSLAASAPASIPLWYFDETNGLWKQEGSATKTGNTYVGDVGHFSYWNCDLPFPDAVIFDATIVDAANNPVPWATVEIFYSNGQYTGAHGSTDSSGYIGGAIPANSQLTIKVFTSTNICAVYNQSFTTTNSNIALGNLTIGSINTAGITGTLTNCSSQPVTNGYVMMFLNGQYARYNANASGAFNFSTLICGSTNIANFIGGDLTTSQEGSLNNYALVSGNNNIGNIVACGLSNQEFVNYTVNSTPFSIIAPTGTVVQELDSLLLSSIIVNSFQLPASAHFEFAKLNIGPGSNQNLTTFTSAQTGTTTIPVPISVNITEYGNIGQFISGTFSGNVTSVAPPNNTYAITCNFRVRRNF